MSEEMGGFKFEIGQIVKHKIGDKGKIFILEKHAQFCYGGLRQNWYLCVLGVSEISLSNISFEPEKRFKFVLIELEKIPEVKQV